jgi:hypothetical protein
VPRVSAARVASQTPLPAAPRRRGGILSRTLGLLRGRA